MEMPLWTKKYNKYLESNPEMRDVSLMVLIILGAETRVTLNEKILAAVADEAFKAIKPENMVLVVNKAPKNYNVTKAFENYEEMRESVKDCTLPTLTGDRILILPVVDHESQESGDILPTLLLSEQFK